MSRVRLDRSRKKLQKILSRAENEALVQMIWAVDALQSDRDINIKSILDYPDVADTSAIGSSGFIYKWELETLFCQLLQIPKELPRKGKHRITNCSLFQTCAELINSIRDLDGAEYLQLSKNKSVFKEMHRIGHRQFPWQRGYENTGIIYRYIFIYGQGRCAEYFEKKYGISISDFFMVGFAFYATLRIHTFTADLSAMNDLGIETEALETAVNLLTTSISKARKEQAQMVKQETKRNGRRLPIAYQPSLLRRFPIVMFNNANPRYRAPLPALILYRLTGGLYYDIVDGKQEVLSAANNNFEVYVRKYLQSSFADSEIGESIQYRYKGNDIDTPDVFVRLDDKVEIVIECKSTKLTFAAQFSDEPVDTADTAHEQLAKGVFQLWKFISHVRRGLVDVGDIADDARYVVLTLEDWLEIKEDAHQSILNRAVEIAAQKDSDISEVDMKEIVFCTMSDIERLCGRSDINGFLQTLDLATSDKYRGWHLTSLLKETGIEIDETKAPPFDVKDLLPWWGDKELNSSI